ncbi:Non-specific serine/threonine protein kinase protein [Dioscorea alata]|uniref:Non-specific serine/threonine protein kinase protein n=2 Tax=Dioscorea alata TaxID=55571 RepID=A0ACB7WHL5_DIOAL|nr:Non-specific serine/threonine protein kinase protein [Dioscorea alata]KAH7687224.1 Non-specific serine/threonine protein kinase protein [Dioscorea alata]
MKQFPVDQKKDYAADSDNPNQKIPIGALIVEESSQAHLPLQLPVRLAVSARERERNMYSWLLIVLKLFLFVQPCFSYLNQSVMEQDIPGACNITIGHYPFAIPNLSARTPRTGFEIHCDSGKPMVQLGDNSFDVTDISLGGQIRIFVTAFTSRCSRVSAPGPTTIPDLQGTPYTYNTTNKFTFIGCDAHALIQTTQGKPLVGCASFCTPNDLRFINHSPCTGMGCCQAPVPPHLKNFSVNFTSISLQSCRVAQNIQVGCDKFFILDPNKFNLSSNEIHSNGKQQKEVVLDWSIGNETCNKARLNNDSFACVAKHSICSDSTDLLGYRCFCSRGFRGNPYNEDDGCKDIDECDEGKHDCVHRCINKIGSYECRCHFGTSGDGRRDGSGCKRIAPLDIGLGTGLGFLIILSIISSWSYWAFKKHKIRRIKQKYYLQNGGLLLQQHISSQVATARIFTTEELELATDGFHGSRVLGHGGYGTVYKGILPGDTPVAIKKSKLVDETQIEQFINEVVILSQIKHRNVVKLLGCCLETQVPLLVYEFISNGTLFQHLHSVKTSAASHMNWETRLRIAVETAAALAYLHGVTSAPIIHRDVKSSNILVDENYTAKVSDFGASRLVPHNKTHVTTVVQGTLGYLDPEYFHTGLLTDKSDVYSFGVVLVELLTRENPVSFDRLEEDGNLVFHFVTLVEENRLIEGLDKETIEEAGIMQLLAVSQLAKRCLNVKGEERPTMRAVAVELEALRRLMNQHFVQEGKVYRTSTSTSLMINDTATQDSMKSMESHLLSESISREPR